jgi:hypothetical protein
MLGVIREYNTDRLRVQEDQWIRYISQLGTDAKDFIIICCSYAQAKQFISMTGIEMDLAFKGVAGPVKVFSLVGWNVSTQSKHSIL